MMHEVFIMPSRGVAIFIQPYCAELKNPIAIVISYQFHFRFCHFTLVAVNVMINCASIHLDESDVSLDQNIWTTSTTKSSKAETVVSGVWSCIIRC